MDKIRASFFVPLVLIAILSFPFMEAYSDEEKVPPTVMAEVDSSTVITVLNKNPNLSMFVEALKKVDFEPMLQEEGPFTIFAPTNAAFKLMGSDYEELLKPENQIPLRELILTHIVPGRVMSKEVVEEGEIPATALSGQTLKLWIQGDEMRVDNASVIEADISAGNGLVNTIDKVLMD